MVYIIVADAALELVIVWDGMSPVPADTYPVTPVGACAVQLNVAPLITELRFTMVVDAPLQIDWLAGRLTCDKGFTIIEKYTGLPAHPFITGVTI